MEAVIAKTRDYLGLVRFSHTLFALPFALASMLLAAEGFPPAKIFLLILAAMVTARNSAMAFNRFADRQFDAENPRTAARHLPKKILSAKEVLFFTGINSVFFVLICYFINPLAFALSPIALGIVFLYSLTKRWTAACHFVLGLALAISPVGAWIAVRGTFDLPPVLLALLLLTWVSGFDVIYSTLDAAFDRQKGLLSVPAKWGTAPALRTASLLHLFTILLLFVVGLKLNLSLFYFLGSGLIALIILWEHLLASKRDPQSINKAFFNANAAVSVIFLGIIAVEQFFFV